MTNAERPFSLVSEPSPRKQRRPGPTEPHYGITPEQWPGILRRIEQGNTLRQIAKEYGVSYETVRRTLRAAQKRERGGK